MASNRLTAIAALAAILLPTGVAVAKRTPARHAVAKAVPVDPAVAFLKANRAKRGVIQTASGLQYKVLKRGTGTEMPGPNDTVLVNYEGKLIDGKTFDKSTEPTPMRVAGVVPGFAEALTLMAVGATYRFWLPPALAYGDAGVGPIPSHSVLVFDVELVDYRAAAPTSAAEQ